MSPDADNIVAARAEPFLQPTVSWAAEMAHGRPYLVTVDLALVNEDGSAADWPLADEEEYPYTCLLDGGGMFDLWAVHDGHVILHRFGGSYGPAEFVVTPKEQKTSSHSLWLTVLNQWGISVGDYPLPVTMLGPGGEQNPARTTVDVPGGLALHGEAGGPASELDPGIAEALAAGDQDTIEIPYRAVPDPPPTRSETPVGRRDEVLPLERTRPDLPVLDTEQLVTAEQFPVTQGDWEGEPATVPAPASRPGSARFSVRSTEYYNVAGLRRSAGGALHWDTLPLFSPGARSGDRAVFTAFCSPSDERGTVFAVLTGQQSSGRDLQLRSVQSAKIPPGRYQVTAELDPGRGDVRFLGLPARPREDPRPWREITRTVPSRLAADAGPAHLVIALEVSAPDRQVLESRLDDVRRLILHVSAEARGLVCYSLVSYGPHSIHLGNRDYPEVPATTLAWAATAADAVAELDLISRRGLPPYGYPYAAQLECVLTDLERDLTGEEGRPVIVSVGSRPPHPPRIDPTTSIIPCRNRNDWAGPMTRLRNRYAGIRFGAVRSAEPPDRLWQLLGTDAAAGDDYLAAGFAQSLGLTSASAATAPPIPLPLFAGGR